MSTVIREGMAGEFLSEQELRGRSVQGMNDLRRGVKRYLVWLEAQGLRPEYISLNNAREYQAYLVERGYARTTIRGELYAARVFHDFLKRSGRSLDNPFRDLKQVRVEKSLPRKLPDERGMALFLDTLEQYGAAGDVKARSRAYRAHVVAELLYATGMRAAEAASLRVEDIDFERGVVRIREGKGGEPRLAWLDDYASEVLSIYVTTMRDLVLSGQNETSRELLFGVKWDSFGEGVNTTFRELSRRLDLPKMTCHVFRHALGYHLLKAGCGIRQIQEILGHKSIKSTEIYTKIDKEDLRDLIDRLHPRRWQVEKRAEVQREAIAAPCA